MKRKRVSDTILIVLVFFKKVNLCFYILDLLGDGSLKKQKTKKRNKKKAPRKLEAVKGMCS